jgi:hypothetical protein
LRAGKSPTLIEVFRETRSGLAAGRAATAGSASDRVRIDATPITADAMEERKE